MSDLRSAAVGDMIIHTPRQPPTQTEEKFIGVVYRIERDEWGHKTAFIAWTPEHPYYRIGSGMPCVNIHNLRREYEVVKGK
jgi:hypothetical protein